MRDLIVHYVDGKGRGVFARRKFVNGETIERAPVIVLGEDPWELLNQTTLSNYYFAWGATACALALGFGSLYNHSERPNAKIVRHINQSVMEFVALRDIEPGEEITHRYQCPAWFQVK